MTQKESGYRGIAFVVFAAALILSYRFPDRLMSGFLWAEDAQFLRDVYLYGFRGVSEPYAGYLHVMPRMAAWLVARTTSVQALQYVIPSLCLLITCVGVAVTQRAALLLPWASSATVWASAIALAPLLIPHSGENYLNVTNLQWLMTPTMVSILYMAPKLRGGKAFAAAPAILVLAMSGPFSVLLLPFAVLIVAIQWRKRPSFATMAVFAAYLLGAAYQGAGILLRIEDATKTHAPPAPVSLVDAAVRDLLGPGLVPRMLRDQWESAAPLAIMLLCITLVVALWQSSARAEAAALLGFGAIVWVTAAMKIGGEIPMRWDSGTARYTFIPYVFLAWALLIVAGTGSAAIRIAPLLFLSAMLLVSSSLFMHGATEPTRIEQTKDGYVIHHPPAWRDEIKTGKVRVLP